MGKDNRQEEAPLLPRPFATTARVTSPLRAGFFGRWGAWIVLIVLLLITFAAGYIARSEATKRDKVRFNFRVKAIETAINERLKAYEFLLRGGVGLFAASGEVTREKWHIYVKNLQISQYYKGIQGIGFSKRILPSEKDAHIRQIRAKGFPQYNIRPDAKRPEYTSIIFLEPFDLRNQRAFGYDMFSEPVRNKAMSRARDTGLAAMSGKVTLVQEMDKDVQAGYLMYVPVYRKGYPPETLEQRRKELTGYVYAPFRMDNFMKGILADKEGYVELQIFDDDKPHKETLLYCSEEAKEHNDDSDQSHFATHQSILEYAGHRWLLTFFSSRYFEENIATGYTNFIFLLGIAVSLLLFSLVFFLTRSRNHAITLANMSLDLERAYIELRQENVERKRAESDILEQRNLSNKYLQVAGVMICALNSKGEITLINRKGLDILGYKDEKDLLSKNWFDACLPKNRVVEVKGVFNQLMLMPANIEPVEYSVNPVLTKNKEERIIAFHNTVLRDKDGNISGILFSGEDITKRKQMESMLVESEERYRTAIEYSNDGVALVRGGQHIYVNQKFLEIFGYDTTEEVIGKTLSITVHPDDVEMVVERNRKRESGESVPLRYDFKGIRKDGTPIYIEISATRVTFQGESVTLAYFRDVTKRKELEEKLRTISIIDDLTGLYNRRGFFALAQQQMKVTERTKKDMLLFFADLDKMKQINDILGHQEGDKALVEIATILKEVFRESDIIGRMGGDEFVILALDTTNETREVLMKRLHNCLNDYNRPEGRSYTLSLSIGIAPYDPKKPSSLDELMAQADTLMYEEKRKKQH